MSTGIQRKDGGIVTTNGSGKGIGAPVRRTEDRRFLTGAGCYTDDIAEDGQCHGVVLRSPHPHARIRGVDATHARTMPGVRLVLTGADLDGRVKPAPSLTRTPPFQHFNRDGSEMAVAEQMPLAVDRARFLGEGVAFVVADTVAAAREAAEAIEVDYAPLTPHVRPAGDATVTDPLWDDCPDNRSFDWEKGDAAATRAALDGAAHRVRLELVNNRIAPVFMEPRSALGEYDPASGHFTLRTGSQTAHRMQAFLADMLGIDPGALRVMTPDMGGGFGARGGVYPEMALVLFAARALGRPVKWTAERSESFVSDTQARDHLLCGELALDASGRFTALDVHVEWRHGAYIPPRGVLVILNFLTPTLGGVYRIPTGHVRIRGGFSNTTPLGAYRGVGRVEATYLMESLVDAAARATGIDRLELRRLNTLTDADLPFATFAGARYEACTFAPHLERAVEMADWEGFSARCERSRRYGLLRGIGCASYVENDGGAPTEFARLRADADGTVTAWMGTQNFGMGHETVYAQVLHEQLGIPFEDIRIEDGDTDTVARGSGSHGSRSMRVGGAVLVMSAERLVEKGRLLAADMLEATAGDVEYAAGQFRITGTDRGVTLFEVAAHAEEHGDELAAEADFEQQRESYSSGCHVCEVEVDPDTGTVALLSHVLVTDVGRTVNPLLVDGQIHGAAAQGLGQAAMEEVAYDPETGQTLTGSLMDYILPRADDLPYFTTAVAETRETDNPLGVKGVGEGPTTGSPAAYMNALRDALARAGGGDVQMPATAEKVWRAVNGGAAKP